MKAQYKHNCNRCIFLGRDIIPQGEKPPKFVDLYLHPSRVEDSLIARYSDEPSDYWAMDIVSMRRSEDIKTQPGKNLLKRYDLYLKGYRWIGYTSDKDNIFFTIRNNVPFIVFICEGDDYEDDHIYEYDITNGEDVRFTIVAEGISHAIREGLVRIELIK